MKNEETKTDSLLTRPGALPKGAKGEGSVTSTQSATARRCRSAKQATDWISNPFLESDRLTSKASSRQSIFALSNSLPRIRLKKPLILEERPTDFFCVFSGSSATLRSLPNAHTEATAERENVLSFSQTGGTTRCLMRAGDLYESTSITYTPGYFESLRKRFPDDFGDAEATIRALGSAGLPAGVRAILRSFTPERASLPGAAPYFHAKALETATALLTRSRT